GGYPKWVKEGRPVNTDIPAEAANAGTVAPPAPAANTVSAHDVLANINAANAGGKPAFTLVDARTPERYRGEVGPIDPVAGHIPGALNRPLQQNLVADGTFKSPEALR